MFVKMHFLHSHLNYFPENCSDYSKEQGERYGKHLSSMKERNATKVDEMSIFWPTTADA